MSYVWAVLLVLLTPLWIVLGTVLLGCLLTAVAVIARWIGAIVGSLKYGREG